MSFNYKPFVEKLQEKADAWRNFCICIACKNANGRPNALLQKFPYKTERIRTHLKNCQNFKSKNPEMYASFFETELREENDKATEISKKRVRRESSGSVYSSISWTSMFNNFI